MAREIERWWHVPTIPSLDKLPRGTVRTRMVITFLKGTNDKNLERVRLEEIDGTTAYTHTRKIWVRSSVCDEQNASLSFEQYQNLLACASPDFYQLMKDRYTFTYAGKTFELDVMHSPKQLVVLELEVQNESELQSAITLPPFLGECIEVTGNKSFASMEVARIR